MIYIVLSLQSKPDETSKHVLKEICKVSDVFFKLQSELASEFTFVIQVDQCKTSVLGKSSRR